MSPSKATRRMSTPRDLLLAEGSADRDRLMAEHVQLCRAASVAGLSATRICQLPGSGLPATTHGRDHAVAPQLAQSKIPVRSQGMRGRICRDDCRHGLDGATESASARLPRAHQALNASDY
jgi:hypothetical protein